MNHYEDYDYAAMQEAEAILNGSIPSTPETYAMVLKFYGSETTQGLAQGTQPALASEPDHLLRTQTAGVFRNIWTRTGPLKKAAKHREQTTVF